MNVTPEQMLKMTRDMAANFAEAQTLAAFVGLPKDKVGGKVYGGDHTIIANGAVHEYGSLDGRIPERSFMRVPFRVKSKDLDGLIAGQFRLVVTQGLKAATAIGRIGAGAVNIMKGAFRTKGYGKWPDIAEETKRAKGSDQVLVDTALLRNSLTWTVRRDLGTS